MPSMKLPAVDPVPGLEAGFLMGSTKATGDDRGWDVVIHQSAEKPIEYTVRQHGCDETNGLLVHLSEASVADIAMRVGVAFNLKKPPAEINKIPGAFIMVQAQGRGYAITLQFLVEEVLKMVNDQIKRENEQDEANDAAARN